MSNFDETNQDLQQENIITLTDEEGNEFDFEVLEVMNNGDRNYAILLDLQTVEDESQEMEAVIMVLNEEEDGTQYLTQIEDDEEWEMVAEMYANLMADEIEDLEVVEGEEGPIN